jgi:transcriptional regulator with XRE-family HTH domain
MMYNTAMSTVAAGAYIRTLRETRQLTRAKLAALTGTNIAQIERIERGEQETRGSLLIAIVQAIQGNLEQIGQLLLSDTATADDGQQLARAWLTQEEQRQIDQFAAQIPNSQIAAVNAYIEQLQADPGAIFRLRGYLERMIEERLKEQQTQTHTKPPSVRKRRRFPWRRPKDKQ